MTAAPLKRTQDRHRLYGDLLRYDYPKASSDLAARSVTNAVERLTELRKNHPEWDDRPSEKALARERLLRPKGSLPTAAIRTLPTP